MTIDEMEQRGNASPRRVAGVVAGVVGVAAVAGGGVWVTQSFLAQGPQPADALPAGTLAYVAVDTDPGGEQKLEAARTLRKFPAAHEAVGGGGDLRRQIFEFLTEESPCNASYADVEPWLGTRAAFALVDAEDPQPVLVLGVDGDEGLEKGLDALGSCLGSRSGHAVSGSWAVIAKSEAAAEKVVEDAATASLSEEQAFRDRTAKAGGAGLVTLYVGPTAGRALVAVTEKRPEAAFLVPSFLGQGDPLGSVLTSISLFGMMSTEMESVAEPEMGPGIDGEPEWDEPDPLTEGEIERLEEMTPEEVEAYFEEREETMSGEGMPDELPEEMLDEESEEAFAPKLPTEVADALRAFDGLGGSLRFEDGTLQLKVVADQLDVGAMRVADGADAGRFLDELPRGMAAATGGGLADDWVEAAMGGYFGGMFTEADDDSLEREFERSTGLDVPRDLETLGGTGVAFVAGPGFDPEELFDGDGPTPVAAVLHGDGAEIVRVLRKIEAKHGARVARLEWKQDGDRVVVGVDRAFVGEVAAGSGLADSPAFEKVLPDADRAASATFVDFDAGDWLARLVDERDRASVKQLDSVGFSRTLDDGEELIRVRLATD